MTPDDSRDMDEADGADDEYDDELAPGDLEGALLDLDELMVEDPEEALATYRALPPEVQQLPEFRLSLAYIHRTLDDLEGARDVALGLLRETPDDGDVHHLLGDVFEDLGDARRASEHFLRTLELDEAAGRDRSAEEVEALLDAAEVHLKEALSELPAEFRDRLAGVPLLVQRLPSRDLVEDGLDPRALGVFEGPTHADHLGGDAAPMPTRIVLFADNLSSDYADPEEFGAEVRITVLHEVGHYFGLDEEDMVRLGLD